MMYENMKNLKNYIVLLRGVTPTGKNKIPKMSYLKEILEGEYFSNVQTYIQSGNIVLKTSLPISEIQNKVHQIIKEKIGAELSVIVKTSDEIATILSENPFEENYDIKRVFFTLSNEIWDTILAQEIKEQDFGEQKMDYTTRALYMYLPKDASRTKLNNNFLERKLQITATTRNFNTLSKLINITKEVDE